MAACRGRRGLQRLFSASRLPLAGRRPSSVAQRALTASGLVVSHADLAGRQGQPLTVVARAAPFGDGHGGDQAPLSLVSVDKWAWIRLLREGRTAGAIGAREEGDGALERELVHLVCRIAEHRLGEWKAKLTERNRLYHDVHMLRRVAAEMDRLQGSIAAHNEGEQRTRYEGLASELHSTSEAIRDLLTGSRTDLSLLLNSMRSSAREETHRLEMKRHQVEGSLMATISSFKSATEQAKLAAVLTFSVVIVSLFVIVITVVSMTSRKADDKPRGGASLPRSAAPPRRGDAEPFLL